jgi:hypothetical protein
VPGGWRFDRASPFDESRCPAQVGQLRASRGLLAGAEYGGDLPGGFGECQRGGPPASVVPFRAQDADEVGGGTAEQAERCTAGGSITCRGGAGFGEFGDEPLAVSADVVGKAVTD